MQNHTTSNIHPFINPLAAAQPGGEQQEAAASRETAEPGTRGNPLAGGATRGRPSTYHPRIIEMLCQAIRQLGLSDSAAAEQLGLSTTTLSRWKQVHPELGLQLQQARQEIRVLHLQKIMESAAAENGKGWRASAWILERLFPEDYARRISDRFEALNLIEFRKDKERRQVNEEDEKARQERQRAEAAARAAQAADAQAAAAATCIYADRDSRNSRNAGVAAEVPAEPTRDDANEPKESGRPCPVDPKREAACLETHQATSEGEAAAEGAAAPFGNSGRGRPDSVEKASRDQALCVYSEGDSQNSRNSAGKEGTPDSQQAATSAKRQQAAAVQGPPAAAEPASASDSYHSAVHGEADREEADLASGSCIYSEDDSRNSRNSAGNVVPTRLV